MPEQPAAPENCDRVAAAEQIRAAAAMMLRQSTELDNTADRMLVAANPAADCDHECDSYSNCEIYINDGDGRDAYCGVARCGNCQQERLSAVFTDSALAAGIQNIYYSEWTPTMTDRRRKTDIHILELRDPNAA